jgi:hypothetical protein
LADFALPCGITEGLSWPAAIFREADFSKSERGTIDHLRIIGGMGEFLNT